MRTVLFCFTSLTIIALSSCRQQDTESPTSHWALKSDAYTATNVHTDNTDGFTLIANDGGLIRAGNTVTFQFPQKPTADGSIIIGDDSANLKITATVISSSGKYYYYESELPSATPATYTVRDGKVTLDIPQMDIIEHYDTVPFSAHVAEL